MASNNNNVTNLNFTFAQPEFKQELAQKADETINSETYQEQAHKAVAMDAAIMAASKSDDFARSAAAGFPAVTPSAEAEGIFELAKEKLGQISHTISDVMEVAKEKIGDMMPGNTDVTGTTPDHSRDVFAQPAFQQELARKADETINSETYLEQAHKSVAMDAAIMAASKSNDFAKSAAAGFPAPNDSEGIMEMAKEKLGQVAGTLSGAMEAAKETLTDMVDMIQLPGNTNVTGTTPDHSRDAFAQPAFQQELARKADETINSETYLEQAHKSVAMDAAIMAASKSGDFAKSAAAGFPAPNDSEGIIDMAKEKLGQVAGTLSGAMEVAKERIGEMSDKIQLPGSTNVTGTTPDHSRDAFAQPAFQQELARKADETINSEAYLEQAHKSVAMDAAIMAASKSGDFAKSAAAGFPAPNDSEGIMEMAKEKLGQVAGTLSGAMDMAKERIGEMSDKIQLPGSTNVTGTTPDHSGDAFAQPAFQQELARKAEETINSETYQEQAHKSVAMDAAIMAASKSGDFAKSAAAGFPAPSNEGMIDMAREKIDATVASAKETVTSAQQSMTGAIGNAQASAGQMYTSSKNSMGSTVEGVREKIGESMEFAADKMREAGEALNAKAEDTKSKGLEMQRSAELNQARLNLQPANAI